MIVYREQRTAADPGEMLRSLRRRWERLPRAPDHDTAVGLLVDLGVLEAGVADALAPERDEDGEVTAAFRGASIAAGHLVAASWQGRSESLSRWSAELGLRLGRCADLPLPPVVGLRVPEGFAQYGLYPECYLLAARQVARELRPAAAVCIGLRSIGTALSAVAVAGLEDEGCAVASCTLRPRGHAFDRRPALGEALRARLAGASHALFLVVDEGPGISGSSLAGTAETVAALGVSDERIVLLPSWDPDPSSLRSESARRRWHRHRRYVAGFDEVWAAGEDRLGDLLPAWPATDFSAGRWRDELIPDRSRRPTVHPQHERRKLRAGGTVIRFAGLGRIGHQRLARARELAEAGFSPHPTRLAHGFLALELVPGTPLAAGEVDTELLDRMARYLAFLRRRFALADEARTDLGEMMHANLAAAGLEGWAGDLPDPADGPPIAVDGRMLPHEWIRTARGYLKVDALDHHDDHFFPGPVDIAWDLAAATVEFDLTPDARHALLDRYRRLSGDHTVQRRLPYYTMAYLACRIGYASLAAEVLQGTADGQGFARMAARYERALAREAPRCSAAPSRRRTARTPRRPGEGWCDGAGAPATPG